MSVGPLNARRLSQIWRRPVEESFVAWEGWSQSELERLCGRDISFVDTQLWRVMRAADPADWLKLLTEVVCGIWEPHAAYRKAVYSAQALGKSIRFPFTDNRLATYVQGLPEQLKFNDGVNKQILRAYMKKNLPSEIVEKPKSGFIFDLNRLFVNPVFRWHEELNKAGLLRVLPTWSQQPIDELLKLRDHSPDDLRWQQRLYALCLLATVLAVKDGYDPFSSHGRKC
jgi:asparagine synthetase B (glutamine-hydrolysing)